MRPAFSVLSISSGSEFRRTRGAGLCVVAPQRIRTRKAEMRQRTDGCIDHNSVMVKNFLELDGSFAALNG
jgi:hypothetical protein